MLSFGEHFRSSDVSLVTTLEHTMNHNYAVRTVANHVAWGAILLAVGVTFSASAEGNQASQERVVQYRETPFEMRPMPSELVSRNAKLQNLLQPSVKSWVETQARIELQRPNLDQSALEAAIRGRFGSALASGPHPASAASATTGKGSGGGVGIPAGADIEELAFIVLMQATNDQNSDLQQIMNEVQAQTKAKEFLRQQMQMVNTDVANNARQQSNSPCTTPACQQLAKQASEIARVTAQTNKPVQINIGRPITYGDLKSIQSNLQGSLDSMNEMSEMTSMRMQMALDRRSKFVEALSNILKKIDDTQDAIIQNLK
jgi:hypothetical protein